MQRVPFSVARILRYGESVFGATKVITWHSDGTSEHTTFAAIAGRAAAFAHALREELGITADQRVATLMHNRAEHLEVLYAACSMGAVFHPLNPHLADRHLRHVIDHAADEVVVTSPSLMARVCRLAEGAPSVRAIVLVGEGPAKEAAFDAATSPAPDGVRVLDYERLLDGRPVHFPWPIPEENDAAALCYTTATTGEPKGVAYSHRSLFLEAMELRATDSMAISNGQSFLLGVPIYHVLSWGVPLAAFLAGTPLILLDGDVTPRQLATVIAASHPRVAHGAPTVWMQLIVHYLHHPPERMSLTEIYVGGAPAPPILIRMWEERYGVDVVHVWGMTEASTVGTVSRPPTGVSGDARWGYRTSQGRFLPMVEYRVDKDGKIVSSTDRNQGEIQVRGPLITGSYLPDDDSPAASEAAQRSQFTPDGWLRTGDVGSVTSDGFLTIHDRARDVIRSGGEWIYSAELENHIMEAPEVVEAAVIGHPDPTWGERPLSVTVLHTDVPPTAETARAIRRGLRGEVPGWMLPEYWAFVDRIDKTSVDKFDKRDLRTHLADGELTVIRVTDAEG